MNNNVTKKEYKQGVAAAILCAVLWGVLPVYWKSLDPINPIAILLYRIVFASLFSFILALIVYGINGIIKPLKQDGVIRNLFFAGVLISTNWGIYIWAVNNQHIIQTCIGYYIEPLIVCVFGIIIFKEKLNINKSIAISFAVLGVLIILIYYGQIPIIALSLAVSFATYAAIKKQHQIDAILSLLYETMLLVPFALIALIYLEINGQGAFAVATNHQFITLSFIGIITGIPLMLFAYAANKISMVTLGITEYISPSLTLILGIFLYHEPFDKIQLITFSIIWIGLIIFTIGEYNESKSKPNK